ncbi:MAG: hypothetical protein O7J95_05340, partial [Planctomycetota bacterium]|nr:hypothetical protein [Planctomycetota bacterium]
MKPIQQHSPGPAMGRPPGAPRGLSTPGCLVGAAFLVPLLALPAPGDVVVLRNGAAIEGRIALETDQLVLVEVDGGGRIRIDKRKVAEVVRDREPAAAERAARPARDLLVLKNGATVEGEIILETPRVVAIKIGRSGTVQYDKRTLKHVIRAERPAAA